MRTLPLCLLVGCTAAPAVEPEPTPEPIPTGPYVPAEYDDSPAERLLFLGDSITAGEGAGSGLAYSELLVANVDDTWPEYIGRDLTHAWPELSEVRSVARGGATSRQLVDSQLVNLDEQITAELGDGPWGGATASVLTIGGNDMQFALAAFLAQGPEQAEERVDLLVENLHLTVDHLTDPERFPDGARVYLSNVYEPTDDVGMHPDCFGGLDLVEMLVILEDANARIRALAVERGVAMIDLRGHFRGHAFHYDDESAPHYDAEDPTFWMRDDCIHPNTRGHQEIRTLFWAHLQP